MLPVSVSVLDGSQNTLAQTQWNYDETSVASESGIVGHDDADDGSGFNVRGNVTSELQWLNTTNSWIKTVSTTYDVAGNALTGTDANGHSGSVIFTDNYSDGESHNTYALPTRITNALGQASSITYDFGTGNKTKVTDANGHASSLAYDGFDRLIQTKNAIGGSTYFSYPTAIETVVQTDQTSSGDHALEQISQADGFGRTLAIDSYENSSNYIEVTQTYDAVGRLSTTTNPSRPGDNLNFPSTVSYDSIGRVTSVKAQDGTSSSITYSGTTVTTTDQAGHSRRAATDALGRLLTVVEDPASLNYQTTYSYTPFQVSIAQGSETRTRLVDSFGRIVQSSDPESGTTTFAYDSASNLTSKTDARNIETSYGYDALNRVLARSYSDGTPTVSYTYDNAQIQNGIGRLYTITTSDSGANTIAVSIGGYDAVGHPLASSQTTKGASYSFAYSYNLAGDLVSETYPSGRVLTTTYDGANRTASVEGTIAGAQKLYVAGVNYWPQGSPETVTYGNNVAAGYTFDSRLQMSSVSAMVGNSSSHYLFDETYNWGSSNNNGQSLYGITEYSGNSVPLSSMTAWSQTFSYDNVNRLVRANDSGGWSRAFQYDQFGNMWVNASSATGVPVAGNTPTSNVFNAKNQIASASYDKSGNQLLVNGNNATYDAENRLVAVSETAAFGGAVESIAYDGAGRRVEKSLSSGTTVYVYDVSGKLAAEYSTSSSSSQCSTCYLIRDHLNSVRLVTDGSANVIGRHDYLPFGEEVPSNTAGRNGNWGAQSDNVEPKFTGQIRDVETGLDYMNARYYASALGRFTSVDPYPGSIDQKNPQTFNRYAYALNNPLAVSDPTGMCGQNEDGSSDMDCGNLETNNGCAGCSRSVAPLGGLGQGVSINNGFGGEGSTSETQYVNRVNQIWTDAQASVTGAGNAINSLGQRLWNLVTGNGFVTNSQVASQRQPTEMVTSVVSTAAGIVGPPFPNQLPDLLQQELLTMNALGVEPISPGDAGFQAAAEQGAGRVNWTLSTDGELLTTPAVDGITHAATAGGTDVIGAGTAQVASGEGQTLIFDITAQSGHYMNGATAAQSESAIQAGAAAFATFFDSVFPEIFPPMIIPPSNLQPPAGTI